MKTKIKTNVEVTPAGDGLNEIVVCTADVPRSDLLAVLASAGFTVSPSGRFLIVDNSTETVSIRSSGTRSLTLKPEFKKPEPMTVGLLDPDLKVEC